MRHQLLWPVGRDQRGYRDEAPIAFGESLALPQVAVNDVVGVIDQCRRERLDTVAFGGRRCLGHASLPVSSSAARRGAAFFLSLKRLSKIASPNAGVDRRKSPGW